MGADKRSRVLLFLWYLLNWPHLSPPLMVDVFIRENLNSEQTQPLLEPLILHEDYTCLSNQQQIFARGAQSPSCCCRWRICLKTFCF